jgi:hypothetical protein
MFEPLKRMYEHLGNGVGFLRSSEIELRQISVALVAWLTGEAPPDHDLNPERITTGSLHRWQERYLVTVSMHHPPEQVNGLRQRRTRLNRSMARWFDECRQRTDTSFEHALRIEIDGYRDVLLGAYQDALNRRNELLRQYEAATRRTWQLAHAARRARVVANRSAFCAACPSLQRGRVIASEQTRTSHTRATSRPMRDRTARDHTIRRRTA